MSEKKPTFRRSALSADPHSAAPQPTVEQPSQPAAAAKAASNTSGTPKQRMPFQAAPDSLARIRATEHYARMHEGYASMSEWMEAVMLRECQRLENKYNDGEPFPLGTPRRGRPAGS
jgi:hypothetical protein